MMGLCGGQDCTAKRLDPPLHSRLHWPERRLGNLDCAKAGSACCVLALYFFVSKIGLLGMVSSVLSLKDGGR